MRKFYMSIIALLLGGMSLFAQNTCDVTGDGNIDIADINAVINAMLGRADNTAAADVNNDGDVNITDVNLVINAMFNGADMLLPTTDFGGNIDDIMAAEQGRGFNVSKVGNTVLQLNKTANGLNYNWTYYFDDEAKFQYAHGELAGFSSFASDLAAANFNIDTPESIVGVTNYVKPFTGQRVTIVENGDAPYFVYGKLDNSAFSWTRTAALADTTGLWMPLLGKGATVELMQVYERLQGHTLNAEKSNTANGSYVFDTGNDRYPQVKYWFDTATKSKLEEAAIFVVADERPTVAGVEAFLGSSEFIYTSLTDATDGSRIYYNYGQKCVAFVLMDDPEDENAEFTPNIHFAYMNIDDQVPPLTVDFPMPLLEFDTMSMDEAIEIYKTYPYFESIDMDSEFGPMIKTTSEDFPYMIIMDDANKYYAVMIIAPSTRIMRSPGLQTILSDMGYTYHPGLSVLPTYINADGSVMAQIDYNDMLGWGLYNISFMPNEFSLTPLVTKLKKR